MMDYNKIADLIVGIGYAYDDYESAVRDVNYKTGLNLEPEPFHFDNFDIPYLEIRHEYWHEKAKELKTKYAHIPESDSDDHK